VLFATFRGYGEVMKGVVLVGKIKGGNGNRFNVLGKRSTLNI